MTTARVGKTAGKDYDVTRDNGNDDNDHDDEDGEDDDDD